MSGHVERPGLYIMVFLCLLNSCSAEEKARKAADILEKQTKQAQQTDDRPVSRERD